MHDPELIWRFGRWIARRQSGTASLGWRDGALVIQARRGHALALEGADPAAVGRSLGCAPAGHRDLLVEASTIARRQGIPETQALAAAKEVLQQALKGWLLDEGRTLNLVEAEPDVGEGPTISLTHALVELLLSEHEADYGATVLPDLDVILRRTPSFLELYSPLRLSEEADLVVAKITGQRTADEIAGRSPHGRDEVVRLLAALVATGMLEPVPVTVGGVRSDGLTVDLPEEEAVRRRLPARWIAAAAVVLAIVLAALTAALLRDGSTPSEPGGGPGWGVVVDMACEPQGLQRVLQKARQHPNALQPLQAPAGDTNPCWRLVWGRFPTREAAERALADIPKSLILQGFQPHTVELPAAAPGGTPR